MHMLRNFSLLLGVVLALPVTGYSSDSDREHPIEKQKLICLYKQVDELLKRRDPVMVILDRKCADSEDGVGDHIRGGGALPLSPNPPIAQNGIGSGDFLMLTHKQLQCFKLEFNKLRNDQRDSIPIDFEKICQKQ